MKRLMETLLAAALAALIACVVMSGEFTGAQKQIPAPDAASDPPFAGTSLPEKEQPEQPSPEEPAEPFEPEEITAPENEPLSDDASIETRGFDKWRRVLSLIRANKRHGPLGKLAELAEIAASLSSNKN
ncbi:hypothetical protein FACS1894167_03940 [Synergistales bacterium]|nr:hypothetical protein FACS1894167_03940 [Synergistales bacterium]